MLHFDVAPKPGRDFPGRLLSHIPHHFCFCQPACRHHTYTHMYQQLAFPRWKRKLKAHNRYVGLRCKAAHSKPMSLPTLQPLHTPFLLLHLHAPNYTTFSYTAGTGKPLLTSRLSSKVHLEI